jgi:hypothetical protein
VPKEPPISMFRPQPMYNRKYPDWFKLGEGGPFGCLWEGVCNGEPVHIRNFIFRDGSERWVPILLLYSFIIFFHFCSIFSIFFI